MKCCACDREANWYIKQDKDPYMFYVSCDEHISLFLDKEHIHTVFHISMEEEGYQLNPD